MCRTHTHTFAFVIGHTREVGDVDSPIGVPAAIGGEPAVVERKGMHVGHHRVHQQPAGKVRHRFGRKVACHEIATFLRHAVKREAQRACGGN